MIAFFTEKIAFTLSNPGKHKSWIKKVLVREDQKAGEINFIFCTDEYLHEINLHYLGHDSYTDIVTFDQSERGKNTVSGDIFISLDRIRDNAGKFKVKLEDEIDRVMIHGILHLCGYEDHSDSDKAHMRKKEDACLSLREY